MTDLFGVDLPIVAAPMAGGPSGTGLVAAVTRAGGFGFLAAGYKQPAAVAAEMADLRAAGIPFGVNVFVPSGSPLAEAEFRRYARTIAGEGAPYGLDLAGASLVSDDDHWAAKIDLLLADPVPVVSFTFGVPSPDVVAALHRAGSRVLVTVTSSDEAAAAAAGDVDGLIVQSTDAGAHSGTHDPERHLVETRLYDLVRQIRGTIDRPLIAAGGLARSEQVRESMQVGAVAVMVGTALLRTDESGASQLHKDALADPAQARTVITRAFTGRPARGLLNGFIERNEAFAPVGYPAIHHLTRPLRAAATQAGDAERVSLWAGTGHRYARTGPAADVIADLTALL
ncbi:MAG TPA: nitronate monooxygenase [Jatrophihabitantaceae bacterium]|jgi:NAD(P)H-dependent flavin oxidoreductase YrpB (nitropropane dioxygenase family)